MTADDAKVLPFTEEVGAHIILQRVTKRYGDVIAVDGVSLSVLKGEFLTLLGPSGCGKTTTLRMIAGFAVPSSGAVIFSGRDVTRVPPYRRNAGMVFQDFALFPHLSVASNIAYGLSVRKVPRPEINRRVKAMLQLVRLPGLEDRYPSQLSGGQKQRVALARAAVIEPEVLLLDEPLGALDLKLREELQLEIRLIQQELGITTIYVTHDQSEALSMSDRVAVMRAGRVVQVDHPAVIYRRPETKYVASFIGTSNFFPGILQEAPNRSYRIVLQNTNKILQVHGVQPQHLQERMPCVLAVRPEHCELMPDASCVNQLEGEVEKVKYCGDFIVYYIKAELTQQTVMVKEPSHKRITPIAVGASVTVGWKPENGVIVRDE